MRKYERCCHNCEYVTLDTCKGCNTVGDDVYQNFKLRNELTKIEQNKLLELPCLLKHSLEYKGEVVTNYQLVYIGLYGYVYTTYYGEDELKFAEAFLEQLKKETV